MHIEVFQGNGLTHEWYWRIRSRNGRVVADNESFPSKANAIRAAKGVVRSIVNRYNAATYPVVFAEQVQKDGTVRIFWS